MCGTSLSGSDRSAASIGETCPRTRGSTAKHIKFRAAVPSLGPAAQPVRSRMDNLDMKETGIGGWGACGTACASGMQR